VANWENDEAEPSTEYLVKLGDLFGINIDDLIRIDIEKKGLITEEQIEKFKQKNNPVTNRNSKSKCLTGKTTHPIPCSTNLMQ